jgi:hypothetical protein
MRCPACGLLAPLASGLFQLRAPLGRPDLARYVHFNCNRGKAPTVLPARFLVACPNGHLDDFPWHHFVHRGEATGCKGALTLRELGVSGEAIDVEVRCETCDQARRMVDAFGQDGGHNLPPCRGRRPHLRDFDAQPCSKSRDSSALLLGASDSWFSVTRTILHVPIPTQDRLLRLIGERWPKLRDIDAPPILAFLRKQNALDDLQPFADDAIWAAIQEYRRRTTEPTSGDDRDIKEPEWSALTADDTLEDPDFRLVPVPPPPDWGHVIDGVRLVERLREVTALIGFTRLHSPRDQAGDTAPLARNPAAVIPAAEVRGEGIFIRFRERPIAEWCEAAAKLEDDYRRAYVSIRRRRGNPAPEKGFPGIRYILLHTFSHGLMRALALDCGYAGASLRERIYARDPTQGDPMAGVLIYTAAPDAEGTLGGLVRMGHPTELARHLARALHDLALCSSDPLCADHGPDHDGNTLHGAACHACLFAPETSCERGNTFLDRNVLTHTLGRWPTPFLPQSTPTR